jgi:hypothetical protein
MGGINMITIFAIKQNGKIISWSTKQMSEDEVEVELTEEEFEALNNIENDEPIPSNTL